MAISVHGQVGAGERGEPRLPRAAPGCGPESPGHGPSVAWPVLQMQPRWCQWGLIRETGSRKGPTIRRTYYLNVLQLWELRAAPAVVLVSGGGSWSPQGERPGRDGWRGLLKTREDDRDAEGLFVRRGGQTALVGGGVVTEVTPQAPDPQILPGDGICWAEPFPCSPIMPAHEWRLRAHH